MQRPKVMIASIGVAVVAAAGGITAAVVSTSSASAAPAAGHSAAATTVRTAQVPVGGKLETILVSATGQPLYYYKPDTAAKSFVTDPGRRLAGQRRVREQREPGVPGPVELGQRPALALALVAGAVGVAHADVGEQAGQQRDVHPLAQFGLDRQPPLLGAGAVPAPAHGQPEIGGGRAEPAGP